MHLVTTKNSWRHENACCPKYKLRKICDCIYEKIDLGSQDLATENSKFRPFAAVQCWIQIWPHFNIKIWGQNIMPMIFNFCFSNKKIIALAEKNQKHWLSDFVYALQIQNLEYPRVYQRLNLFSSRPHGLGWSADRFGVVISPHLFSRV